MGALWVATLRISAPTEEKINRRHNLGADEVREAVVCIEGLDYVHHHHEVRGWRYLIRTTIRDRPVLVVLYDAYDPMGDVYNLGSAYFID